MTGSALQSDCARCAALCCVAPAFDRSDAFAIDKPAGTPCPHLDDADRCAIHAARADAGFKGCIAFDCLGAGQRVTQEIFDGRSWRTDPALLAPLTEAFRVMRQIHELLLLVEQAGKAPLSADERLALDALAAELEPAEGWSRESLMNADIAGLDRRVRDFLKTLRRHFSRRDEPAP